MKISELIEQLIAMKDRDGDHEVVIVDSNNNTCDIENVEFIRYAHPTFAIHTV